tara:strand:- start:64 stop:672 length:609 start_codon:yes stop_codon:yes gene_type:complete
MMPQPKGNKTMTKFTFKETTEDTALEVQTAPISRIIVPVNNINKIKISIFHNAKHSKMPPRVGEVDFYFKDEQEFCKDKHLKLRNNLSKLVNIRYKLPQDFNSEGVPEWYAQGFNNCQEFEQASDNTVLHCKLGKKETRYENILGTLLSVETDAQIGSPPVALLQLAYANGGFNEGVNQKFNLTKFSSKGNSDIYYGVFSLC